MTTARLQSLSAPALDLYYATLTVNGQPYGRYDGQAWIIGHPLAGKLIGWLWQGKDFDWPTHTVTNRILGRSAFRGFVSEQGSELVIDYTRPPIRDTLRRVSPGFWLGRMRARWVTVHFTMERAQG